MADWSSTDDHAPTANAGAWASTDDHAVKQTPPYNPAQRGAKMKGTPSGIDDSFMGTLAKDFAGGFGVGDAITGVIRGAYQATHHPLEALQEAGHQIIAIPGSLWEDMKAGKFGKLGARITEAAMLNPEATENAVTAVAEKTAPVAAAVAEKVAPGVAVAKGAASGAVQAIPEALETSVLKYTGVPKILRGAIKGGREALAARIETAPPSLPPDVTTTVTPPPAVDIPAAAPPPVAGSLPGQFPVRTTPGTLTTTLTPPPAAPVQPGTIPPVSGAVPGQSIASTVAGRVAPVAETPGMALARASGQDWASLTAGDQAILEQIAKAQSDIGQRMAPPRAAPVAPRPIVETPPAAPGKTLAEQIAEDVAARKAAEATPPAPAAMPPETATMAPAEAEAVFQQQKARIQEGMTPPPDQPPPAPAAARGPSLLPLPEDVPPHYQALQQLEGTSAATRTFLKDRRIADYLLNKGVTPEQFEAMPLEDQNRLIVEAPSASARGKHRPFVPRPEGAAPRAVGRWAEEGVKDIADTMRWIQEQTPEKPPAPAAAAVAGTMVPDVATAPGPALRRTVEPIPQSARPVERPAGPAVAGTETSIRIPGEEAAYKARYAVRELEDVHPSHNPHTFQPNPRYEYRNDRNYGDPANQERIVVDSQPGRFTPEYLITDSPDAVNGAPVISEGGSVVGGNSRAMKLARVYANNPQDAAAYRALLERQAERFGIDPASVRGMKRPVLVRQLTGTVEQPQHLITDLNKTGTAALTATERATADARRMSTETADYLAQSIEAEGPDATLNAALSGKQGAKIINQLVDDGVFTMQEKPQLIDAKTGALTAHAKERISKMLLGQVFADSEQMVRTAPEIRNKLERIVSPLIQSGLKPGFDILPTLRESLDLIEYARAHDITQMSDVVNQQSLFGDAPRFSPRAVALAEFIRDEKPTRIATAFRRYVANAEPTMFGESTPAEAFTDAFGAAMPPEAAQMTPAEAEAAFQKQKAKARRR